MAFWNRQKKVETKDVPSGIAFTDTMSRGAIPKAYFPGFLYKPPFGWPKFKDIFTIRRVAQTPQAAMAINTVIDEVIAVPWDIVPKEDETEDNPVTDAHKLQIKTFFDNPNTNKESFNYIQRIILRDLLELDSGIIVKEFNVAEQMVEIRAVDSAGFLKNPDPFGKILNRDDLITEDFVNINMQGINAAGKLDGQIDNAQQENLVRPGGLSVADASLRAAYFQFGYLSTARPVPFGKRELVWIEKNPVPYDQYGRSPIENLVDILQTLVYSITYNLEYFEDNNVPKGFIQLAGASKSDLEDFQNRWNDIQLKRDVPSGRIRKIFHRVPITNSPNAEFKRVQFSAQEMELISSQKWFSNLVWMMLGVTPSEMGFTESSNRATEIAQSRVFKRRAVLPLLKILEYYYNKEIVSEFGFDDVEFKFNTFDVETETTKYDLYKIQVNTKIKTINEIRREEGLPEVAWGDAPQMTSLNPVQQFNPDKENEQNESNDIRRDNDQKAFTVGATLGNVTLGEHELISKFMKLLKITEANVLAMIKQEAKKDRLTQIKMKSLDDIGRRIEDNFDFDAMRNDIMKSVEAMFNKGWEKSEDQLEKADPQPTFHQRARANQEQIKFIQKMTFDNIKGVSDDFKNKIKQELRRAIIDGHGVGRVIESIKGVFDVAETRVAAIVRTELNRSANQGSLQSMKNSGIVKTKTWLAALDDRTSPLCRRLDKKTVGINENFKDSPTDGSWDAPPSHVNCRSTLLYDFKGDIDKIRASSNELDLKFKYIKRTGSPGDYQYFYRQPSGRTGDGEDSGDKKKPSKPEWKPTMNRKEAEEWSKDSKFKEDFFHGTSDQSMSSIKEGGFKSGLIHFTDDKNYAKQYSTSKGEATLKTKIDSRKPFIVDSASDLPRNKRGTTDFEKIKSQGFDAIKYTRANGKNVLIVFDKQKTVIVDE